SAWPRRCALRMDATRSTSVTRRERRTSRGHLTGHLDDTNRCVRLAPRDIDKLLLHNAGFVAQKRLARGVRLNYPESVALIATQLLEFIRDGRRVAELMDLGRQLLGHADVMDGVA